MNSLFLLAELFGGSFSPCCAVLAGAPLAALTFQGWFWQGQSHGDADFSADEGRGTGAFPALFSLFLQSLS